MSDSRRIIAVEQAVLAKNERMAERNREEFSRRGILVLNLVSSPGSGKTALLERTLADLAPRVPMGVIVGDLATDNDAARLRGKGAPIVQITTDGYCHLEANMVAAAAHELGLDGLAILVIENVGNLVCPSSHDLGEDVRVALLSVTEGEDKPLKYPVLFKSSHVVLVTKTDLAEACEFDQEAALRNIHEIAPQASVFEVSAKRGTGLEGWYGFLASALERKRSHGKTG